MTDSSVFELTGFEHIDHAHNTLFYIPEFTALIGNESLGGNLCIGLSSGSPTMVGGMGVATSSVPLDLTTDGSTPGRALGDDSSLITTSENPESIPFILCASAILATGAEIENSSSPNPEILVLTLKNDCPNSHVEKNAAGVYNTLHGDADQIFSYPAVITENPESFETAAKLFRGKSMDKVKETLQIWEGLLNECI